MIKATLSEMIDILMVTQTPLMKKALVREWFDSMTPEEREAVTAEIQEMADKILKAFEPIRREILGAARTTITAINTHVENNPPLKRIIDAHIREQMMRR
jgi:hypothetical protein